ncbi:hypothetical protein H4O89_005022, partial [Escherichia coli]|nr:hypothetical protein [Escherichia coli]EET7496864.1 hypothetical protein [Escherichia coli]EFB7960589.1 hypothetical protein [Escherichia coli]EFF3342100.1 hypothetical protein [Escherichia coli]EFN0321660.1 hypothetical protein [Escherichia coli]
VIAVIAAAGRGQTSPLMRMPFRSRQQNYFFCIPFRYNNFQIQPDQMSNISGSLDKKSAPTVVRVTHLQK